jgi:ankyrin repeat protein
MVCLLAAWAWPALSAEIHDAASDGDLAKVRALVEKNPALVNLKDAASGSTPLHEAARKGHVAVVEFLLASKADVNARDRSNLTPLKLATGYGRKEVADVISKVGATATAPAARPPSARALQPANTSSGTATDIPVNVAARAGELEKLKALLKASSELANATNSRGVTPLQIATMQGHQSVVELLLASGANVNARATNGSTPLLLAAGKTNLALVKLLLAKGADVTATNQFGQFPLISAATRRSWPVARVLLEARANPNAQDSLGYSALNLFARAGHREAVAGLLAAGANPNLKELPTGATALHYAASLGDLPMTELLVSQKADLNITDNDGFTPLSHALLTEHAEVATFLKQKGAIEAAEKPLPEPQRSLVEAMKKFDTTMRTGTRDEIVKAFGAMEPTAADLARIFGANAAKAGQMVAKEKQEIIAELNRSRPPSREGEIIRIIPKPPMMSESSRTLIASDLPLNSLMVIRKGEGSMDGTVYCHVNQRWVRLPSLFELAYTPP